MSCVDILASFGWFLSTWAVPEGSFVYSKGNKASCNFQGFLLQLAIGAPLYNSSLAIFYLLMIKRRWTDDQLKSIERAVHGAILSFTVGTSILLLCLGQYNHVGAVCWVIGDPPDCGNSSFQGSDIPCDRGDYAYAWGLALFYGPLWFCVICCCSSMAVLWLEVRKTHRKSRRYSSAIMGMQHSTNRSGQDEKKVAVQAILYSLTFVITWMPSTLWSVAHWFNWKHYILDISAATAEPLQGLWNFLIFLKSRPETVDRIRTLLSKIFPCCCTEPPTRKNNTRPPSDLSYSFATGLKKRFSVLNNLSDLDGGGVGGSPESEAADFQGGFTASLFGSSKKSGERSADVFPAEVMADLDMSASTLGGSIGVASFLNDDDDDQEKEVKPPVPSQILGANDSATSFASENLFLPPTQVRDEDGDSSSSDSTGSDTEDSESSSSGSESTSCNGSGLYVEGDKSDDGMQIGKSTDVFDDEGGSSSISCCSKSGEGLNTRAAETETSSAIESHREIQDLVTNHCPEQLGNLGAMLKQFKGREDQLIERLKNMQDESSAVDTECESLSERGVPYRVRVLPKQSSAGSQVQMFANDLNETEKDYFYFT
eukprot:Sro621_g176810.2  (598) ;mRNA; r:39082-40875